MARALGLNVVAEGVERDAQRRLLIGMGCRQAQGFFYARPAPAPVLEGTLDRAVLRRAA